MIVYGGRKNCSSTIHIPEAGKKIDHWFGGIRQSTQTSNDFSEEEQVDSLVQSTRSIPIWIQFVPMGIIFTGERSDVTCAFVYSTG